MVRVIQIMIKVSIIIPVYNVEKYIPECLDSVINQSLKEIEIICVDDCSTDNSYNILLEYAKKDNRIKIIKHDKNKGLGPARNTGCGQNRQSAQQIPRMHHAKSQDSQMRVYLHMRS